MSKKPVSLSDSIDLTIRMPSLTQQLLALAVGGSVCRTTRLDGDAISKADIEDIRTKMRNSMSTGITRAKAKNPDAEYVIEGGEIFTRSQDLLIVQAITRLA